MDEDLLILDKKIPIKAFEKILSPVDANSAECFRFAIHRYQGPKQYFSIIASNR